MRSISTRITVRVVVECEPSSRTQCTLELTGYISALLEEMCVCTNRHDLFISVHLLNLQAQVLVYSSTQDLTTCFGNFHKSGFGTKR